MDAVSSKAGSEDREIESKWFYIFERKVYFLKTSFVRPGLTGRGPVQLYRAPSSEGLLGSLNALLLPSWDS